MPPVLSAAGVPRGGTYKVPKEWLLEFLTSEDYNSITRKSKKHYAMVAAVGTKKRGKKAIVN